jgi:hypothetical protein
MKRRYRDNKDDYSFEATAAEFGGRPGETFTLVLPPSSGSSGGYQTGGNVGYVVRQKWEIKNASKKKT